MHMKNTIIHFISYLHIMTSMKNNIIKTLYDKPAKETIFYEREAVLQGTIDFIKGYDERFPENVIENDSILLEIIKNIEKIQKLQYLESILFLPDEYKIQVVKDFSEESDILPMSIVKGGLFNNWELDGEFDS